MDLGPERIELDELLDMAWEAAINGIHVGCPAVVVNYDRAAGTVELSLPIDRLVPDGDGNLVAEPLPNLKDVPIAWMRCRAFAITFPLVAGDTGQLVICERSISAWRAGTAGHPGDTGMFTLDGSVFHPGLADNAHASTTADANNMIIGSETDGKGRIEILPAGGHLGAGATKGIVRKGDATTGHNHSATFALTAPPGGGAVTGTITIASNTDTMDGCSATWKAVD